jgi:trigger factor
VALFYLLSTDAVSDKGRLAMAEEKDQVESTEQQEEQTEQETPLKDRISVDVEDAGTLRKKVKVTVPREVISERLDKQFKELRGEAALPGFRKGHAPRVLIEKRFGKDVTDEVRTAIVAESYDAAVEKESLDVLGQPDLDPKTIELPTEGNLEFSCEVEIKPQFELPSIEGIEVKKPKIEVSDEDVTREIDRFRALRGTFQATNEPIKADDMIVGDVVVTAEGQEVSKQEGQSMHARARVFEGMAFENFGDVIVGAKPGDTRTVEGTLPDDYEKQELRGKKATVAVTVKEVKRMVLPEMNAELLSGMGFESEEEMRKFIRERLTGRLDQEVQRAMRTQVEQYLLENVKFDLPEKLSGRQTERAVMRRVLQMRNQGVPDAEISKHMDDLRVRVQEQTRNDLKLFFVMNKIAEQLEVDVTEGELNARIAQIAQAYGRRFDRIRDDMMKDGSIESLVLEIRDAKVVDKIIEKAKITEEAVPAK